MNRPQAEQVAHHVFDDRERVRPNIAHLIPAGGELRCDAGDQPPRHLMAIVVRLPEMGLWVAWRDPAPGATGRRRRPQGWRYAWLDEIDAAEYIETTCNCGRARRLDLRHLMH